MLLLTSVMAGAGLLSAADGSTNTGNISPSDEISQLKATLIEQQKQLQTLQQSMKAQQELLEKALGSQLTGNSASSNFANAGQVASTTPMLPIAPAIGRPAPAIPAALSAAYPMPKPVAFPLPQGNASSGTTGNPCEADIAPGPVPAYIRLGNVCVVPIGFMDFTPFFRDKNANTGTMGSNFGSVPYNNVANGNLSESRYSNQNSRLGFRVDGNFKGVHFIGYNEFDFNGTSGAANLAVTNGAIVPRLRLFWIDVRKDKWEFLAGQSWSMLTPNRVGISALPGDLFYSQVIDINYMAGLTWSRQPGARILFHPNKKVVFGFSTEQADQYMGGGSGGGAVVLPANLTGLSTTQLDNGAGLSSSPAGAYFATPTYTPDFIAKLAIDLNPRLHFEVAGIVSTFRLALNQNAAGVVSIAAPFNLHPTTTGAGLQFGFNAAVLKNLRLVSTNFVDRGEGRYMFGQAPDVAVSADGRLHGVQSAGTVDGFEATVKNTLLYGYYGGIFIRRDVFLDANGTSLIGYGYKGSSNSQNRSINEVSFGFNQTAWKNARYGAINIMGQYEYLMRDPWFVAPGSPKATHDNTVYLNIRYTLPGSMPNF
jgi:hypothetical protein